MDIILDFIKHLGEVLFEYIEVMYNQIRLQYFLIEFEMIGNMIKLHIIEISLLSIYTPHQLP